MSKEPKAIVAPIDFSDLSIIALRCARELAKTFGAELIVVYGESFIGSPDYTYFSAEALAEAYRQQVEFSRSELKRLVSEELSGLPAVTPLVMEEGPVSSIVQTAEARDADLIVMGTHGRGGLTRLLLGSVSERILREGRWPVLTVRPGDGVRMAEGVVERVLCPVNFSEVAQASLEQAALMTDAFGAELHLLHVVEPGQREVGDAAAARLESWISDEVREHRQIRVHLLEGNAAEKIVELAEASSVDLIVMGAQHKRFFNTTVIGTTSERVTRHAPCPVLNVARPA